MQKHIYISTAVLLTLSACLISCNNKETAEPDRDGSKIVATASLGAVDSKVAYTGGDTGDITAAWESGDALKVFEDGAICNFSTTDSGSSSATFSSTDAVTPSASTTWKAVLGKASTTDGSTITCAYDGQDGTLAGLSAYDYMVAGSTGTAPSFNFSAGTRLTYFLRLKLPAGIRKIEFCSGTWTVTASGETAPVAAASVVSTAELSADSSAGQIAYIAVPAIDYSNAGLIITIISNDGTKSQGKVLLSNLSGKGGKISLADMSGLTLMDRPNAADAIVCGGVSGKWAPFAVGAKRNPSTKEEATGPCYSWGETEPQGDLNFSSANYIYQGIKIGTERSLTRNGTTGTVQDISGSRYDVARVKWGSDWRMVKFEEIATFGSQGVKLSGKTDYQGIAGLNGVLCESRNTDETRKFFLPARSYYKDKTETNSNSGKPAGFFWVSQSNLDGTNTAYHFYFTTSPYFANTAKARYCGLGVWAVLAD